MVRIRGIKCALGGHPLVQPSTTVKDPKLISFVRMRIKDFRPEQPVCLICLRKLEKLYKDKLARAHQMKHGRNSHSVSSTMSFSSATDVESSRRTSAQRRRQQQRQQTTDQRRSSTQGHSTSTSATTTPATSASIVDARSAAAAAAAAALIQSSSQSSQSTLDEGPSTSAAAATARQQRTKARTRPPVTADTTSDDPTPNVTSNTDNDEDDYVPSPNALNGTRLPHIQPIPKRQQFVHANPDVLDIYMAGLTGG